MLWLDTNYWWITGLSFCTWPHRENATSVTFLHLSHAYMTVLTAVQIMQMGNECSSSHVASLVERPLVEEREIPVVGFIILPFFYHSPCICPCKRNCCCQNSSSFLQFFFYLISTPGNCLWEAFVWRKTCGNRIRDLYAWWEGIRRQDKTSTYISGIHESTGWSVSVEKQYL